MQSIGLGILVFIGTIVVVFICALLFGWIVMLLWNWLMPVLFGLTTITYIQGVGILFLTGILFRSNTTVKTKSND